MFDQLLSHPGLLSAVSAFGFTEPTDVQTQAIPAVLEGHDLLTTAQTGSGKTLAWLLPVVQKLLTSTPSRLPRALIVLPTRELAQQIADVAKQLTRELPLRIALVTGSEDHFSQQKMLRRGGHDIVIGTPGRLQERLEDHFLELDQISHVILDEADRLLDMGFANTVTQLARACAPEHQTLLFSATEGNLKLRRLSEEVLKTPKRLRITPARQVGEHIRHQLITSDSFEQKLKQITWLLQNSEFDKAVVFCNTREHAEQLYGHMSKEQLPVFILHGECDRRMRTLAVERLRNGKVKALIATDVAARGLDVEGLDLVINLDVPRRGDDYLHRVGRTGRADAQGLAITLAMHFEWNLMASIARYLKLDSVERRIIDAVPALYQGPEKLKASGKAAGTRKKKEKKAEAKDKAKASAKKAKAKKAKKAKSRK